MSSKSKTKYDKPKWNPIIEKFFSQLMSQDPIRTCQAAEVGRRAVDYFRGKDFFRWVSKNREHISEDIFKYINLDQSSVTSPDLARGIGRALIQDGFVYSAVQPPQPKTIETKDSETPIDKGKWPRKLQPAMKSTFEDSGFYAILYERRSTARHLLLSGIVGGVLLICLFPVWPLKLKIGVWYATVFISSFFLFLTVLRLAIYVLLWFCGFDFWICPNLFDEELGFVDSFFPWYSFENRKDNWLMLCSRVFCAAIVAISIYQLGRTHSLHDIQTFTVKQIGDILDWGTHKLTPAPAVSIYEEYDDNNPWMRTNKIYAGTKKKQDTSETEKTATGTESENEKGGGEDVQAEEAEEDYSCLAKCGFDKLEDLLEDCLTHCECMEELVKTPCFKNCPSTVQSELTEAKLDACFDATEDIRVSDL